MTPRATLVVGRRRGRVPLANASTCDPKPDLGGSAVWLTVITCVSVMCP
jgi:hypothetical protein